MLIYVRRNSDQIHPAGTSQSNIQPDGLGNVPAPPPRALEVINGLNAAHDEACEIYAAREKRVKLQFQEARRKVMDIYRSWTVSSHDEVRRGLT
jgi:hypothetical protein